MMWLSSAVYFGIYIYANRRAPVKTQAEERAQYISKVSISAIRTEMKTSCFLHILMPGQTNPPC